MRLFDEFLKEEISDHTRRLLLEALHEGDVDANIKQREFTFNRFNVVIDFESHHVKIDDELTVTEEGQTTISIAEFIKAIQEGAEQKFSKDALLLPSSSQQIKLDSLQIGGCLHVIDALSIEGTSNFGVLCYGVFSLSELDAAHRMLMSFEDRTETKIQRLIADQWPNGVLLLEVTLTSEAQVPYAVVTVLSKMLDAGSCLSAVCMFDGVFGGYEDIFSDSVADQTYAFCFTKNQHVLNMDSETLLSKEWSSIIALCRKRLG